MRRLARRLLPALVAALWVTGCGVRGEVGEAEGDRAVEIEVTHPRRITVQRRVDVTGTLTSPDAAEISSEVAGVVSAVEVELGQDVRRGQVLVRLDARAMELERQRAESALRQTEARLGIDAAGRVDLPGDEDIASVRAARAGLEEAKTYLARAEQLARRGLVSSADREAAETRLKVADATYQEAVEAVRSLKASVQDRRAALALASKRLDDTTIRSVVDGAVTARPVSRGAFIRENTPVVTLMRLDPLRLTVAVQERFAGTIRPGMLVRFQVEPYRDATFEARIAHVSPAIDPGTRTFSVEATVTNPDRRLKPGFFAKGAILTHADAAVLAVPEHAVSTLSGISNVFVVEGDVVTQRQIAVGERQGTLLEVVDGLSGSERLAATNLNQLATNVTVTVRPTSGGGR